MSNDVSKVEDQSVSQGNMNPQLKIAETPRKKRFLDFKLPESERISGDDLAVRLPKLLE